MPGILGVNIGSSISNRKISSKITFKEGEKFTGKIIKKQGEKSVIVKLADGWKFEAEIDEDVNLEENVVLKFSVKDTSDGKLKLKIVRAEDSSIKKIDKDELILKFIKEKGVSKEEALLMKEMVQREIPLTKENVNKFKEILYFLESIKNNGEEEKEFTNKFLQSKSFVGEDKKTVEETLKNFFQTFKKMSKEEVMVFLENNIELTKENIEGYNKLFKEDKLNELIKEVKILIDEKVNIEGEKYKEEKIGVEQEEAESKETIKAMDVNLIDEKIKGITEGKFIRALQENINLKADGKSSNVAIEDFLKILENINKEEDVLKNTDAIGKEIKAKENVQEVIGKILGKDIKLNEGEYKKLLEVIEGFEKEKLTKEVKETIINKPKLVEPGDIRKDEIVKEIKNKIIDAKDVAKGLEENFLAKGNEKILAFVKNNIGEFKIFNAISNEYYYLDIPINLKKEEYPCKLIIKDNRKDNKSIDKNNVKVIVSLKTINLGYIDGYIHLNNNNMDVKLKCDKEIVSIIKGNITNLKKALEKMNLNIKVDVEEKIEEVTLANCREFFKKKESRFLDTIV
ncbi:MAG: hypothetical protein ACRC30_00900 [Clostridium sp.]